MEKTANSSCVEFFLSLKNRAFGAFFGPFRTSKGDLEVTQVNTSNEHSFRISCSFTLVGIRPLLSDELQRRMSLIELKPQTASPESPTGFMYPNLLAHIRDTRGELIWTLLVLVCNWMQNGRKTPKHAPVIGSYEE